MSTDGDDGVALKHIQVAYRTVLFSFLHTMITDGVFSCDFNAMILTQYSERRFIIFLQHAAARKFVPHN